MGKNQESISIAYSHTFVCDNHYFVRRWNKVSLKEIIEQVGYFIANGLLIQSWITWRDGYFSFNAVSWYLSIIMEGTVIILMALQVIIYNNGRIATNWMFSLFWLPTSLLFVYLFAVDKGVVPRFLSKSKVLVWIGKVSADAFLIHHICIKVAEVVAENKLVVVVIAFVLTVVCIEIWQWFYRKADKLLVNIHRIFG